MSRLTTARALTLAAAVALAATLAGCGKTGELQRPGPATRAAGPGQRGPASQDPTRPVNTVDPRDEINNPAPSRSVPIQGQAPDPTRPGPQGSLPDPYRNPR